MSRNTLIGPLLTPVEVWSGLAINKIGPKTSYKKAKQILKEAHFDYVDMLYDFLLYNFNNGNYSTSVWNFKNVKRGELFSDRKKSLDNLKIIAKDFLHEQRNKVGDIRVLTYPQAYEKVVRICHNSLRLAPDPRYVEEGKKVRGRSDCRIKKIVPVPGNTAEDRLRNLIESGFR